MYMDLSAPLIVVPVGLCIVKQPRLVVGSLVHALTGFAVYLTMNI